MASLEQRRSSEAKSKSRGSYIQANPAVSPTSHREQKCLFLILNLMTKLGPLTLVRCARIGFFLRFVPSPKRFLDAGCGTGTTSFFLAKLGLGGMAVDFSPESISEASRLLAPFPSIEVRQADINSIVSQGNFDIVIFWEVLEHIGDDAGALENIRANLKMGGHLILSVPCRRSLWNIWDEYAGHLRRYEADELVQLLFRTGYQVISFQSGLTAWHFTLLPMAKMLAWMRKDSWKRKPPIEMTKKSGISSLYLHTIFDKPLKLFLNVTLLPFFLALEAIFARNLSFAYSYHVLARKVR
jgi:2-polyprenyl-3-methyl-5-hydroxy-6-metoxy-1,4-benzoquinol methylase